MVEQDFLERWLSSVLHRPLLLTGGDDETVHEAAWHAVQQVVCATGVACGTCDSCMHVARRSHPDVIAAGDEAVIGIDEVRELLRRAQYTATDVRRVVLLEKAERVSVPAATALLKSLEDVRPDLFFVLATQYANRLPETVRSRCVRYHVRGVAAGNAIARWDTAAAASKIVDRRDSDRAADIAAMEQLLRERLANEGPSPAVQLALQRVRDYYRVRAERGNERLAWDVLLTAMAGL